MSEACDVDNLALVTIKASLEQVNEKETIQGGYVSPVLFIVLLDISLALHQEYHECWTI
jgi:hypothetical protein